jgi:murein endopeptidase
VKRLGRKVKKELGMEIGINDISYANGALMPPHASHRSGVDVDIRLLRKDGAKLPVTIYEAQYSRPRNKVVVEILLSDSNISFILFNDTQIAGVQSYPNHHHHMHAHFKT